MAEGNEKGLWASFIDAVMRALSGAFIAAAGALMKDNLDLRVKLREAQDEIKKAREIERLRNDAAVGRLRDKWKNKT